MLQMTTIWDGFFAKIIGNILWICFLRVYGLNRWHACVLRPILTRLDSPREKHKDRFNPGTNQFFMLIII